MTTLLVSGCSFSEEKNRAWPQHVSDSLNLPRVNCSSGSMGNDLIARRLLRELDLLLKQRIKPVVCVMWSGWNRTSTLSPGIKPYTHHVTKNPMGLSVHDPDPQWLIHNQHWTDSQSRRVFKTLSFEHLQYLTLEHIVHTQWRLNQLGVPWLFMQYKNQVFPFPEEITPDHQWLIDQIQWSNWIQEPMYEWCQANPDPSPQPGWDGEHPTYTQQQIWAAERVTPRVHDLIT